ncbi:MAG TPA: tetratricopeptide repeat protein [Flavobacteriales bacterium]|nr:tetratricopeptide repeat protein [Flavobacteriales bacterium]MCB0807755.1 tetratricopeptide repeat protein [Flavobacteriales bacterium]MCB9181218.1 tetratricopeptide repeat protein [Flavobacteriales bacterium]MCB9199403.1 tetratricopeptide repeat protein [Flavobacteriales bacterium]HOP42127.1 tetratricopeptide repeat protein [Flavobacteriales bacterium]
MRWCLSALLLLSSLASSGQESDGWVAKGDSLLQQGRAQRAVQAFDQAIEEAPSARTYSARARAWYVLDRMDRYIVDVETALHKDSTWPEANYQRALYAMRAGDPHLAERHATTAIEHGSDGPLKSLSLVLRGTARSELLQREGAIEDLTAGLKGRPDDTEAMTVLARLLDQSGRHDEALQVLTDLCEREPEELGHWSNRGYELAALGRHEDALAMYAKALAIDPDEPVALSNQAASLLALGRKEEAMKAVTRSLKGYPSNAEALKTRALLLLDLGERSKACDDLTLAKALGEDPEVDRLHLEFCSKPGDR